MLHGILELTELLTFLRNKIWKGNAPRTIILIHANFHVEYVEVGVPSQLNDYPLRPFGPDVNDRSVKLYGADSFTHCIVPYY